MSTTAPPPLPATVTLAASGVLAYTVSPPGEVTCEETEYWPGENQLSKLTATVTTSPGLKLPVSTASHSVVTEKTGRECWSASENPNTGSSTASWNRTRMSIAHGVPCSIATERTPWPSCAQVSTMKAAPVPDPPANSVSMLARSSSVAKFSWL